MLLVDKSSSNSNYLFNYTIKKPRPMIISFASKNYSYCLKIDTFAYHNYLIRIRNLCSIVIETFSNFEICTWKTWMYYQTMCIFSNIELQKIIMAKCLSILIIISNQTLLVMSLITPTHVILIIIVLLFQWICVIIDCWCVYMKNECLLKTITLKCIEISIMK